MTALHLWAIGPVRTPRWLLGLAALAAFLLGVAAG